MATPELETAKDLLQFLDASPTPYHACGEAAKRLQANGFQPLEETQAWPGGSGRFFCRRGGSLLAWAVPENCEASAGFRILGAHTDSPNLRLKPQPDRKSAGWSQLGVEVYGGVLLNSWLDRDLGLSGQIWLRSASGPRVELFRIDRPILRVPQLAIHLNREIYSEGLQLNKQQHMAPVWGLQSPSMPGLRRVLADLVGVAEGDVLSWDAMCHDLVPATLGGLQDEFVFGPRLDNLCSSHGALSALQRRLDQETPPAQIPVVSLFDHEEVGSASNRGADSPLLGDLLERIVIGLGGDRESYHRAIANSICVSADMAHATHPNYAEKHEPNHTVQINGGPVIKINQNLRYASEGETEAMFQAACEAAQVPVQKFVNRSDLACGSTIGPLTAARLGIRTVDVGSAQLSMHSIREMCGSKDPEWMIRAMTTFLT
ncbi:MAG: M18 family aminopeptidase [Planctomycetota bacterium]|nr:MAG: M18 family aminopeptidase [Planctomycetota bacterium]